MTTSTLIPAVIQPGNTLGTSPSVIAVGPTLTQLLFRSSVFSNVSGSAATITVFVVRIGGSPFGIITGQAIAAGASYWSPELAGMVLNPGDEITAECSSGSAVNVFISGFSVVG